jgi:LPS-assembly protein
VQGRSGGYARFVAGQSIHVGGENPFVDPGFTRDLKTNTLVANFSDRSGLDTNRSDYVLGAYLAPTDAFKLVAQSRFDEQEVSLRRANLYSSLSFGPALLQAQYSYTRDDALLKLFHSEQEIMAAATLRLTDRWSITGLARYDLDQSFLLQDQIQLRFTDECFVLTATYTENFINNPSLDVKPDRSLMLRFELKYLGDFKYKTDSLDHLFGVNQPAIR